MTQENDTTGGVRILKPFGEIDLHAAPALRAELATCSAAKTPVVLLDFSEVDYIDSSGLAMLIEYLKASADFGGKLGLFGLKKKVRAVFELVRLDQLFVIGEDGPETVAKLQA